MTRISIIGLGRVGLATGVAFATLKHEVHCLDTDRRRVKSIGQGNQPFYEKGLTDTLRKVLGQGNFHVTDDVREALKGSSFYFICVGTPSKEAGGMDSRFLRSAASSVGRAISLRTDYPVVAVKSTVVPGTTENIIGPIVGKESKLEMSSFGLCMNPEFLREGTALDDTLRPDRIIIGSNDKRTADIMEKLFDEFLCTKWHGNIRTAEMVKYATNAFLATKASFANEIANICGTLKIDSDEVLQGMALDSRINPQYLMPGVGFGGSCLPKDVRALISEIKTRGYRPVLLETVLNFNKKQAIQAVKLLKSELKVLKGKRIAVLGLAFKPETDDSRESQAIPIIAELKKAGAKVVVHDPVVPVSDIGMSRQLESAKSPQEALLGVDGCIIQTAWNDYKDLTQSDFSVMKKVLVVDGRRTISLRNLPKNAIYRRIG